MLIAVAATLCLVAHAIVPDAFETERYWLAWLGAEILRHRAIPTTIGAESPLATGQPWVPQEWLYALAVELARRSGAYLAFAILSAFAAASLLWHVFDRCVSRRVEPHATNFLVALAGCFAAARFSLRAENWSWLALVMTVRLALAQGRRRYLLVPLFATWANIHGSFVLGLLILLATAVDRKSLRPVAALSAAATLINPFGVQLWTHTLIVTFGWVHVLINEWAPLYVSSPIVALILIVLFGLHLKSKWSRHGASGGDLVHATLVASGLYAVRNLPIAAALALPEFVRRPKCFTLPPYRRIAYAWVVANWTLLLFTLMQQAVGAHRDPDFGLLVPAASPVWNSNLRITAKSHAVVYCDVFPPCNVVLFLGGHTFADGRADPFSEAQMRIEIAAHQHIALLNTLGIRYAVLTYADSRQEALEQKWTPVGAADKALLIVRAPDRTFAAHQEVAGITRTTPTAGDAQKWR